MRQLFVRSVWLMPLLEIRRTPIREGERAVELMPVSKSAVEGSMLIQYLAVIYAWVGDKDRAIERLAQAANLPGSRFELRPSAS